jgi:putative transposase
MVRQARQRCESGIYHIVLRGINRGDIFFDEDERLRFLETLEQKKRKQEYGFTGTV